MSKSLDELSLRLAELASDLNFLASALELRPRIHQALNFATKGDALELARRFGALKENQPASLYGPMLIRLVASLERYLRLMVGETIEEWGKYARAFDDLPAGLVERNMILTGRSIAASESPKAHLPIDPIDLIDNLATCRKGSQSFTLNTLPFMSLVTGVTAEAIESSLRAARIENWQDAVGADSSLQSALNTSRVPDTTKKVTARLKELSRWRNNWAHGGDDEVALTNDELKSAVQFVSVFSKALDKAVFRQFKRKDPASQPPRRNRSKLPHN